MTRSDRDPFAVQDLRHVVRVDAVDVEGDDPGSAVRRRPVGLDPGQLGQALEPVRGQLVLVLLDRVEADLFQVVNCGTKPDRLRCWCCPRFELVWQLTPRCLVELHAADHVAAHQKRLHRFQQLGTTPEEADPARPAHLVRRNREKIAVQRLDIYGAVGRRLCGVTDVDRTL